jgi:endonuclease-3
LCLSDLLHANQAQKADLNAVEDAIRCGGLAQIKAARIANILNTLLEERGSICLEYVRNMTSDQIKAELSRFKGGMRFDVPFGAQ